MDTAQPEDNEIDFIVRAGNYIKVVRLADGSVAAIGDLMFTRAIYLGCNMWGYDRRFCFEDRSKADSEFEKLQSEDDVPEGWIARR